MKRNGMLFIAILFLVLFSFNQNVSAGNAGVGVLNVPPKYGSINITEQNDNIRVYLTISDYNSWADIYAVRITLEDFGTDLAIFEFKQYKQLDSYVEVNEFSEEKGNNLLQIEKCSYEKSEEKDTIDQRCDINIRFVFKKTWFTTFKLQIFDRDGSKPATSYIDYSTEESMRSSNILFIPGIDTIHIIEINPLIIEIIAIIAGFIGAIFCIKKKLKLFGRKFI